MGQTNPTLCPYCGAEMYARTAFSGGIYSTWYECLDCDASSPMYRAPDQKDAIYGGAELAQRRYVPPIKLLTWNELKERKDDSVWVETKETEEDECAAALVTYVESEYVHFRDIYRYFYMTREEMGKVWRCWPRRPTDEERMAAAWEVE